MVVTASLLRVYHTMSHIHCARKFFRFSSHCTRGFAHSVASYGQSGSGYAAQDAPVRARCAHLAVVDLFRRERGLGVGAAGHPQHWRSPPPASARRAKSRCLRRRRACSVSGRQNRQAAHGTLQRGASLSRPPRAARRQTLAARWSGRAGAAGANAQAGAAASSAAPANASRPAGCIRAGGGAVLLIKAALCVVCGASHEQ